MGIKFYRCLSFYNNVTFIIGMKKATILILSFVFSSFIIALSHNVSYAGYLIKLKNGRSIAVSDYKDTGKEIKFFSQGGEITVSKEAVHEIKHMELKETETLIYEQEEETVPEVEVLATPSKDEDKTKKFPTLIEELANLYKQREALAKEREELVKKRDNLLNDIKQEGTRVLPTKKKELKRRFDALEEEIKRFNERVTDVEKREETIKSKIESLESAK